MKRGLVCPEKAREFDQLHANSKYPKYGRNNTGAKELASGYTRGTYVVEMGGALDPNWYMVGDITTSGLPELAA